MKYVPPLNADNEQAPYINGDPSTGQEGSRVPAKAIEHPQREIIQAIKDAGLTPDADDLTQLSKAISGHDLGSGPIKKVEN